MKPNKGRGRGGDIRPAVPYWEDPVYHYLSRRHLSAVAEGRRTQATRLDYLIQEIVNRSMSDELYRELDTEAKADRRERKQERKKRQKALSTTHSRDDRSPSVNVAELKRRIFNPHVSRENVIRALEALPAGERNAAVASLPPGLRRKLGNYLKGRGH